MTTERPERSSSSACPAAIVHPSAKSHTPYVDRPPLRPPIERQGQIASQEHASKYGPETDHERIGLTTSPARAVLERPPAPRAPDSRRRAGRSPTRARVAGPPPRALDEDQDCQAGRPAESIVPTAIN